MYYVRLNHVLNKPGTFESDILTQAVVWVESVLHACLPASKCCLYQRGCGKGLSIFCRIVNCSGRAIDTICKKQSVIPIVHGISDLLVVQRPAPYVLERPLSAKELLGHR